jgi:hypothetical protein
VPGFVVAQAAGAVLGGLTFAWLVPLASVTDPARGRDPR